MPRDANAGIACPHRARGRRVVGTEPDAGKGRFVGGAGYDD